MRPNPTRRFRFLSILFAACASGAFASRSVETMTMDLTQGWEFEHARSGEWLSAEVPGCIHSDLLKHELIPDPYFRTNSTEIEWVDRTDWRYRTTFEVSAAMLERETVELVFEGVDTYADIFLNDTLILSTDNYFLEWVTDVKPLLREGENRLEIQFQAAMRVGRELLEASDHPLQKLPDDSGIMGGLTEKKVSLFTRKPGYQFGWDWTERFVSVGLRRPVFLRAWNEARLDGVQIIQESLDAEKAELTAHCTVTATRKTRARLEIRDGEDGSLYASTDARLLPGEHTLELSWEIHDPEFWWSHGLGEAHLYALDFILRTDEGNQSIQSERIGLRNLRLVRDEDPLGESFYFELNGEPVFMKGANYIPQDNFLDRVSEEDYRALIQSSLDANMNMLRVWGGGIYERDIFYDLCDENGLLVWQDFMFGGGVMYPATSEYLANVSREVEHVIKKLRNRPSIALWCGNNEVYEALSHWGWKQYFNDEDWERIWDDYYLLFNERIPELVDRFDPTRSYWPSSPLSDWDEAAQWDGFSGDIHYWEVWFTDAPFEKTEIRHGRFNSEYGFQSFPAMDTVARFSVPKDWRIDSPVMKHRQKSFVGNEQIRRYMEMYYRVPDNFADFVYLSQVLQASGIKTCIQNHRKHMPVCMGSLYWQLNDCWPAISWSSVDYYGNWKALQYAARDSFAPVIVVPEVNEDVVNVYIVSDRRERLPATLQLEVADFAGKTLWQGSYEVQVAPNTSRSHVSLEIAELLHGAAPDSVFLHAELSSGGTFLDEEIAHLLRPKDLQLPPAEIELEVEKENDTYLVTLSSEVLCKNVYLHLKEGRGHFSDNYFDLLPDVRRQIRLTPESGTPLTAADILYQTLAGAMD